MFAEGRRFTFIKSTEGLTGPDDPAMANNVAGATAEGLLVGVYHYAHPENRPSPSGAVQEADHLLGYAGSAIAPGRLPPVLDLESKAANLTTSALTDWVIAFCDEIIAQRGPTAAPFIYCSQYFANSKLDSRLADYNLWLADPSSSADPATDDPPGSTYPKPTGAALLILTEAAALALAGELVFLRRAPLASCPANYFCLGLDSAFPFRYFLVSGPTTSHSGAAGPP
jgi:hypothetical protein